MKCVVQTIALLVVSQNTVLASKNTLVAFKSTYKSVVSYQGGLAPSPRCGGDACASCGSAAELARARRRTPCALGALGRILLL